SRRSRNVRSTFRRSSWMSDAAEPDASGKRLFVFQPVADSVERVVFAVRVDVLGIVLIALQGWNCSDRIFAGVEEDNAGLRRPGACRLRIRREQLVEVFDS